MRRGLYAAELAARLPAELRAHMFLIPKTEILRKRRRYRGPVPEQMSNTFMYVNAITSSASEW